MNGASYYDIPVGSDLSTCRGCGVGIFWIETPKGKRMPVDPDGTPHWATCPQAKDFKRMKEAKP